MQRFFKYLAAVSLGVAAALPASAEPARPTVRQGDFFCFRGMGASDLNILPGETAKRPQMRLPKLGNSKFDNTDGHDLREVKTEGDYRILVILVNFNDVKFSTSWGDSKTLINQMLNGKDFNFQGATGSVNDYFRRVSGGQFNPIFDVAGPVTLSKNEVDYVSTNPDDFQVGPDGSPVLDDKGKPIPVYSPGRMVEEAVLALKDEIDFSQYDSDNDGLVDFVYLFFAGVSATTGGTQGANIWPHAFTLTAALGAPVEVDGVAVNRYCTSSELGSGRKLAGIGTFCHEFTHVLGLPDFYDTANNGRPSNCFTPGCFSSMDAGYYNNDEHTPPVFSSYEQYSLEWMKPAKLSGTGNYLLLPHEARPFAYQVQSLSNPQEYYLFEARGNSYLDQYLKGHGLLVWHIDFNLGVWDDNKPNNDASHQRIDVVEADNNKTEPSRNGDPFPGASGICEFTKGVTPAFKDWKGDDLGYEIRQIHQNFDGTVSFAATTDSQILPEAVIGTPVVKVVAASANSLELEWAAVENADDYYVSVFNGNLFDGSILPYSAFVPGYYFVKLTDVENENGICRALLSDLPANMNCGIMLYATNDLNASATITPVFASTVDGTDFNKAVTNVRLSAATEGHIIAEWDAIEGADEYELVVANRLPGKKLSEQLCDFADSELPAGWNANGKFENRKVGNAAPSYSLNTPGSSIQSGIYDNAISEISFWACRRYSDNGSEILIFSLDKGGKPALVKTIADPDNKGEIIKVDMPAGTYGFRIVYNFSVTDLFLYIDDLNIIFSEGYVDTPVADAVIDYNGNAAAVHSLKQDQEYVAYVYPVKDSVKGLKSNETFFRLEDLEISGVEGITDSASAIDFAIDGYTVIPADDAAPYSIYAIDGSAVIISHCGAFTLPAKGIYLISANGATRKIIL
ncbi:MAG: M6 family metalloprotease domain-containing protein [Muribaculaceae bacterium]|nr:M6 family metalloprotease domain-containing protein [Muribaculaceae bacterium]